MHNRYIALAARSKKTHLIDFEALDGGVDDRAVLAEGVHEVFLGHDVVDLSVVDKHRHRCFDQIGSAKWEKQDVGCTWKEL
jgi:hypothetical protein